MSSRIGTGTKIREPAGPKFGSVIWSHRRRPSDDREEVALQRDLYMTVGNEGGVRKVSGILDETTSTGVRWSFLLMEVELLAISQTRFASTSVKAQLDFHPDEDGEMLLTVTQFGQEVVTRKLE